MRSGRSRPWGSPTSAISTSRWKPASSAGPSIARSSPRCSGSYWRDPQFLEQMMSLLLPMVRGTNAPPDPAAAERRAAEALLDGADAPPPPPREDGGRGDRDRRDADLLGPGEAEAARFRTDVPGGTGRGAPGDRPARPAGETAGQPAHPGRSARPGRRLARHDARGAAHRRRHPRTAACGRGARAGRTWSCSATSPGR